MAILGLFPTPKKRERKEMRTNHITPVTKQATIVYILKSIVCCVNQNHIKTHKTKIEGAKKSLNVR